MSPSSTIHGGQYDTNYAAIELLWHAAFVVDEIGDDMLVPACTVAQRAKLHVADEKSKI